MAKGYDESEVKTRLIDLLKKSKTGMSGIEISENLGINRTTMAKYLDIFAAEGIIQQRNVGNTHLWLVEEGIEKLQFPDDYFKVQEKYLDFLNNAFGRSALGLIRNCMNSEANSVTLITEVILPTIKSVKDLFAEGKIGTSEQNLLFEIILDSIKIINLLRKNLFAITGDYESTKKEFFKFQERLTDIEIENNDWNKRQISAKSQIDELTGRREEIKEELSNIKEFPEKIINDRNKLRENIGATEYQKSEITSKLSTAENQLLEVENAFKEMNIKLANAREEKGRIEATLESNDERKKDIIYSAKEIVGCDPDALVNQINADVLEN